MAIFTHSEWTGILRRVRQNDPNLTRHWFDQLRGGNLDHGILEIRCANTPQQRYLGQHCTKPFCIAAQEETGRLVSVRFTIDDEDDNGQQRSRKRPSEKAPPPDEETDQGRLIP